MSRRNPIKFLDSYTREDKDIFFGRDKDTAGLYEKVNKSKVVLLYGLSGTGKTSLIHCGLENKFEEGQRQFIYVRRGSNLNQTLQETITSLAGTLIHPNADITERLEILYFDYLKPITLVYDQFEELFISGSYDEKTEFINTVAKIVESGLKVKQIFSLREEYLAHMDEFEEKIPMIFDHRYRLEKMRRGTLEEVIYRIAETGGVKLEDESIPGMIIDNISDRKGNVELPYLQVYLDKLTRLAERSKNKQSFTVKLVEQAGELEDVLGDFLDEQITRIEGITGNREAINFILKQLITPDGTKRQVTLGQLKVHPSSSENQLREILKELELSRLVKLEDGIYELSHDSLAQKVAEKRTAEEIQLIEVIKFLRNAYNTFRQTDTLLDRKQLKYIQPFLQRLDLSEEEMVLIRKSRRKEHNRKVSLWAIGIALLLAILAGGWYWQFDRYRSIVREADAQLTDADYREAKTNYMRALDIYVPGKEKARKGLALADSMLQMEPLFNKLINEGNGFFSLGVNHYDLAFERYEEARELGYNNDEAELVIRNKQEDAVNKYIELAKVEQEVKHTDIALAHLARAHRLIPADNEVTAQFNNIVVNTSRAGLTEAGNQIREDNPGLIPFLNDLIDKAGKSDDNRAQYELLKTRLNR